MLSPPWQKGAERARQGEAADTSRASLGQADRLRGEDNSSEQQVLGDKLLEESYRALSPWALPCTRQPPASLLVQLCIFPLTFPSARAGWRPGGSTGLRQHCGNPVTTDQGAGGEAPFQRGAKARGKEVPIPPPRKHFANSTSRIMGKEARGTGRTGVTAGSPFGNALVLPPITRLH